MIQFPTHVPKTDNKKAANKYIKVNGQSIYNGALNRFARNIVMKNLHSFIAPFLKDIKIEEPVFIIYTVNTVLNHGDIRRINGEIRWKPPVEGYKPRYDLDNLSYPWIKAFQDTLQSEGCIPNDDVMSLRGFMVFYMPVSELSERSIDVDILTLDEMNNSLLKFKVE